MKRFPFFLVVLFIFLLPARGIAQKEKKIAELFNKYFISVPYEKKIKDWINELYQNENIHIDPLMKGDSGYIFFRAKISNFHAFSNSDSIWLAIDQRHFKWHTIMFGRMQDEVPDSSLDLTQIYYFSLKNINEKQWKSLYRSVIKDFRQCFFVIYPGTTQKNRFTTIWFSNEERASEPIIRMQYGKIEERNTYFIQLGLVFRTQTSE